MGGSKRKPDTRKRKGQKEAEQKQRVKNYKKKQQNDTRKESQKNTKFNFSMFLMTRYRSSSQHVSLETINFKINYIII